MLPWLHLLLLRGLLTRPSRALPPPPQRPEGAPLWVVKPRDLPLWPVVLLALLRARRQLLPAERKAGHALGARPGLVWPLVLVRVALFPVLSVVKLLPLGLKRKGHPCVALAQLALLLPVFLAPGVGRPSQAYGHEVLLAAPPVEPPVPLTGQHGHQGRPSLWLPAPLLCGGHKKLPGPVAVHPAVKGIPNVLLHLVVRLLRHPVVPGRARPDRLTEWAPVLLGPRLAGRVALVPLHRPHVRRDVDAEPPNASIELNKSGEPGGANASSGSNRSNETTVQKSRGSSAAGHPPGRGAPPVRWRSHEASMAVCHHMRRWRRDNEECVARRPDKGRPSSTSPPSKPHITVAQAPHRAKSRPTSTPKSRAHAGRRGAIIRP